MSSVPMFTSPSQSTAGSGLGINPGVFSLPDSPQNNGQNQYMNYPSMSSSDSASGFNPTLGLTYNGGPGYGTTLPYTEGGYAGNVSKVGAENPLGGGIVTEPTLDPALTQTLSSYLTGQVGQGLPQFNGSVMLPSSGQMTTPGSLTAPLNSLMQQLQQFYMGQSPGVTGASGSTPGSTQGPLSYILPMFQSEISAMNQPIQQQYSNINEQMASMGLGASSAEANALANYGEQTSASEDSLLGQLTMEALPQEQSMATGLQSIDQQAIQNAYSQYQYTLPQNNPLNNEIYGLSTTFPPTTQKGGSGLEGLLASVPGAVSSGMTAADSGSSLLSSILSGLGSL